MLALALLLLCAGLLPAGRRRRVTAYVERIECRTGISGLLLCALLLYWLVRLLFLRESFLQAVGG